VKSGAARIQPPDIATVTANAVVVLLAARTETFLLGQAVKCGSAQVPDLIPCPGSQIAMCAASQGGNKPRTDKILTVL
jgi:hypothetical protein